MTQPPASRLGFVASMNSSVSASHMTALVALSMVSSTWVAS